MLLALVGGAWTGYALNVRFASHTLAVTNLPMGLERFLTFSKAEVGPAKESAQVHVTRLTYLQARPDEGPKPVEAPFIEGQNGPEEAKSAPAIVPGESAAEEATKDVLPSTL